MKPNSKRQTACLSQNMYYSDNSSLPNRAAFEQFWEACGVLGNDRAEGYLRTSNMRGEGIKSKNLRVGDKSALLNSFPEGVTEVSGMIGSKSKGLADPVAHIDLSIGFMQSGYWGCGHTPPHTCLDLSESWYSRITLDSYLKLIKLHCEIAGRFQAISGFVDVSDRDDTLGGAAFGSITYQNIPFHRWIEQARWVNAFNSDGHKLRSVYWGNYIGKAILDRLGGQDFLERYRQQATWADGSANAHIWEFPNGSFLSVCFDPSGCFPGRQLDAAARSNSIWLVREFLKAGVLS